jgi:hypothetical protein
MEFVRPQIIVYGAGDKVAAYELLCFQATGTFPYFHPTLLGT